MARNVAVIVGTMLALAVMVVGLGVIISYLWGIVIVPVFGLSAIDWGQGLALLLLTSLLFRSGSYTSGSN